MAEEEDPLCMYILLRRDFTPKWSAGALVAQACHASTAALWLYRDDPATQAYVSRLDDMRKVVLEAPSAAALGACADSLTAGGVAHKLWVEQPEGVPTCLATKPYPRSALKALFAAFKLLR